MLMSNQPLNASTQQAQPSEPTRIKGLKYWWNLQEQPAGDVLGISMTHGITLPIAHVLASRGYKSNEEIRQFLFCSFEQDVSHPGKLKGAQTAADRILKAVEHKEKILIFGDYDVDGVTSASLMLMALLPLGAQINYFLPNRKRDGYGLSSKVVKQAIKNGYSLIITVDNGISAYEAAKDAAELGIDLIITDHHRPHDELPQALAIVNPNQVDCEYPFKHFAGVGVAFKLMSLVYEMKGMTLPEKVYELLTMGTIADVVPLSGENRFWVQHGLAQINRSHSFSFAVLAANGNLNKELLSSTDIGFMIAPQINALGRLDDSREAVKFLLSSDQAEIERVGAILKSMNEERKKVEQGIHNDLERAIAGKLIDLEQDAVIVAAHEDWPAGVIGLVAGKLAHSHGRPTILLHHERATGLMKGSCRSIPEFDIFNALSQCHDLLLSFGGHSFAAGLKLSEDKVPELKRRLEEILLAQISRENLRPKITLDAPLELADMTNQLLHNLQQLEPFGNKNPQPTFYIKQVSQLKQPQLLKDKHVKCTVFADGVIKPVIFFNRPELYNIFVELEDKPFSLAAQVSKNEWQGKISIELQGIDIAL